MILNYRMRYKIAVKLFFHLLLRFNQVKKMDTSNSYFSLGVDNIYFGYLIDESLINKK